MRATLPPDGGKPFLDSEGTLRLPCGKCFDCLKKRSIEWATRCRHEIAMHEHNCFITLTYNDQNLPDIFLVKKDFQDFMKRLRKSLGKRKIRYIMCGEYGTERLRPHFHALIFGWSPKNQQFLKLSPKGEKLYTSESLGKLWDKGFHSIGQANEKTAYYVANYALKGKKHTIYDSQGEEHEVSDYMTSSKRPAIGYEFFKKNIEQIVSSDKPIPRYYVKKLQELDMDLFQEYQDRIQENLKQKSDHELFARYLIEQQKLQSDSEFRPAPEISREDQYYKQHLKSNRDLFQQRKN